METSKLKDRAHKIIAYNKSKQLRHFINKHREFHKSMGNGKSASQMLGLVANIEARADLLEGEAGIESKNDIKYREEKQLDEIERSIFNGKLHTATEQFNFFLQNAYDGTGVNEKSPRCTGLWTLRHYVDMNNGSSYTRSDVLAQRLLDAVETNYTGGRCNKKRAYSVTKQERDKLGFSFSQLQRLNSIFSRLKQNVNISMEKFLDLVEDVTDEKIAEVNFYK